MLERLTESSKRQTLKKDDILMSVLSLWVRLIGQHGLSGRAQAAGFLSSGLRTVDCSAS